MLALKLFVKRLVAGCWAFAFAAGLPVSADAGKYTRELIEQRESLYNNIYVYKDGSLISLMFGHNKRFYTETIFDSSNELELPVPYTQFMTVGLAYVPSPERILEIGFGGGRTSSYLHHHFPQMAITSVELDPAVVELAKKYFAVREGPTFRVETGDGRRFLAKDEQKWSAILIDAYRGPFVPFHLLTVEFYELLKERLLPGGVIVQNIEPSTMMFDSALSTMNSVFHNVDLYDAQGNVVAVAYIGEKRGQEQLMKAAADLQSVHKLYYPLAPMLADRRIVNVKLKAEILSDDFAPVEALLAIERHNRKLDAITRPAR